MSADNQIVILQDAENTFRVAMTFVSGENFGDPEWVFRNFKNAKVFSCSCCAEQAARKVVNEIEKNGGVVEYGIVKETIDYPFPSPVLEITGEKQEILAVFGYMKWRFPYIPIFMEKTKKIHILSGGYGTSLDWLKAEIKENVSGIIVVSIPFAAGNAAET